MKAFHNKQEIKDKYIARMKQHMVQDDLIRGIYYNGGKGCAVGCTLHSEKHKDYETELGIPEWLAHLEDGLFERMSLEKSKTFPLEFLESINVGSRLKKIRKPFLIYILNECLATFNHDKFPDVKHAIDQCIIFHETVFDSKKDKEKARAVVSSASYTARYAARDAYYAVRDASYPAANAANAAANAANAASYANADSYAAGSAASAASYTASYTAYAAYDKYADKLIQLIKECK